MLPEQAKGGLIVIKILAKGFYAVMAGHAVRTKGQEMTGREDQVDL